jgi:hypothetical protein
MLAKLAAKATRVYYCLHSVLLLTLFTAATAYTLYYRDDAGEACSESDAADAALLYHYAAGAVVKIVVK